MGKFDKHRPAETEYEELELSLMCERCNETSTKVRYFAVKGIVAWKCPNNHKNMMEGFFFG